MVNESNQNIYKLIGQNIKKYRQLADFTQAELADMIFMSPNFIAKLESKTDQTLSIDTTYQIAKVLNIDIRKLYDDFETLK